VLDPDDAGGLPDSETTISQMLRGAGYRTMCIGKWHLGSKAGFLPTARGFDEYFGIPYSNDMSPCHLMHNTEVIERPAKMNSLTQRYTHWATEFISRSRNSPFFLYLPHTFPHIPLAASERFVGRSGLGDYGDAVQELDWSVGAIAEVLKETGLDGNTLVMFTSDNGPWFQGSVGGLRGRKGETYEGGHRVPMIARFPGRIPEGRICERMSTALDIFPTIANATGTPLPAKRLDGVDIWPLLAGQETEPDRDVFLYFNDIYLQCARFGPWKLHLARYNVPMFTPAPEGRRNLPLPRPELYHVVEDPGESYDRAERNSDVVTDLQGRLERLIGTFPADIVRAYNETMQRQVEHTPVNALPVERSGNQTWY
jgi:arylsulfatase